LFVLLTLVGVYRLTLLDRGALAFVDETHYFNAVMMVQAIGAGDAAGALHHVASYAARPGATLMYLPTALAQVVPFAFGIAASNPYSLLIPTIVNVGVSLTTLYFFFHICLWLYGDEAVALLASLLYALLVNTNLYVRHLLPYDLALLVAVFTLSRVIQQPRTTVMALASGLLAGVVVATYPGYYLLVPILGVALMGLSVSSGVSRSVRLGGAFAAGVLLMIAAVELLTRAGGLSYIGSARALSRTIGMGSFDEGWTFVPDYLLNVERASGVMLLIGTGVWMIRCLSGIVRRTLRPIDWLLIPAFAAWTWQAFAAAELHSMVLYGRLIHPWMVFMAFAVADMVAAIDGASARRLVSAGVAIAAVGSWALAAREYSTLAYPPDVLYALGIDAERVAPDRKPCELTEGTSYASPGPLDRRTKHPYSDSGNYVLVNFCQGPPSLPRRPGVAAVDGGALLFDGPHWLTFAAYDFELMGPEERAAMTTNDYRVRAYRVP